jgi:hypothetical protein
MEQRRKAGLFHINGIDLDPVAETLELAQALVEFQAEVTVRAIERAIR